MNVGVKHLLPSGLPHIRAKIKSPNIWIFLANTLAAEHGKLMDRLTLIDACLENIFNVSLGNNQHMQRSRWIFVPNC